MHFARKIGRHLFIEAITHVINVSSVWLFDRVPKIINGIRASIVKEKTKMYHTSTTVLTSVVMCSKQSFVDVAVERKDNVDCCSINDWIDCERKDNVDCWERCRERCGICTQLFRPLPMTHRFSFQKQLIMETPLGEESGKWHLTKRKTRICHV